MVAPVAPSSMPGEVVVMAPAAPQPPSPAKTKKAMAPPPPPPPPPPPARKAVAPAENGNNDGATRLPASATRLERGPEFKGDFKKFLMQNLRYPNEAISKNVKGKVIIEFMVDAKGKLADIHPYSASPVKDPLLVDEASRILALSSGQWTPAKQNGKPVKVYHQQSINFVLAEE